MLDQHTYEPCDPAMSKQKILVIEDERPLVEVLSCNLEREGFEAIARL